MKLLIQQNEIGGKRKTAAATRQLEQAQERIAEVSRIIKRLYEDNVNGKISDERFMELSADYEQEQRELKDRAAALQEELDKSQAATVNAEKFMGIVRKHPVSYTHLNRVTYFLEDFILEGGKVGYGGAYLAGQRVIGYAVLVQIPGNLIEIAADPAVLGGQLSNSGKQFIIDR